MAKKANPQGKGGHLLSSNWFPAIQLQQKSNTQIISDYVLSMLVLSAEFSFRPAAGNQYYLYLWKGVLRLSLIPENKRPDGDIECLAVCELGEDLTWRVQLKSGEHLSDVALDWLQGFVDRIKEKFTASKSFSSLLPHYEATLPFYRRLFAAGLAKSLSLSAGNTGLLHLKAPLSAAPLQRLTNQVKILPG